MRSPYFPLLLVAAWAAVTTGCTCPKPACPVAKSYRPNNVYAHTSRLPQTLRRVAILPATASRSDHESQHGLEVLPPILWTELQKRNAFELLWITPEQLNVWFGRPTWHAEEQLPQDFLGQLRAHTDCDAVLFVNLTTFRPYPPLQVGWKLALVSTTEGVIWWSVDEVTDAGCPAVAHAAHDYARDWWIVPTPPRANQMRLDSPRQFGQFVAATVVNTLPAR